MSGTSNQVANSLACSICLALCARLYWNLVRILSLPSRGILHDSGPSRLVSMLGGSMYVMRYNRSCLIVAGGLVHRMCDLGMWPITYSRCRVLATAGGNLSILSLRTRRVPQSLRL